MTFLTGALFGASIALVLVMILRRPPGITKHARRDTPIDIPHREFQRKYRDAREPGVAEWNEQEVGGIDYRFINITGMEDK